MGRKEITNYLTELLIGNKLNDRKYYAKEVTIDYGTVHPRRIDIMEFRPAGVLTASDIEKGLFVCYEIKSCKEDVFSGHGLNFYGEYNYIVTTMQCYKDIQEDIRSGKLDSHIASFMNLTQAPEYGILVAVPGNIDLRNKHDLYDEYDNPHDFTIGEDYKFWDVYPQSRMAHRTRSMNELLFCMLRAKHSN